MVIFKKNEAGYEERFKTLSNVKSNLRGLDITELIRSWSMVTKEWMPIAVVNMLGKSSFSVVSEPGKMLLRPLNVGFGDKHKVLDHGQYIARFEGIMDINWLVDALGMTRKQDSHWEDMKKLMELIDDSLFGLKFPRMDNMEEEKKDAEDPGNESGNPTEGKDSEVPSTEEPRINQEKDDNINSTNNINTASDGNNTNNVNAVSSTVNAAGIEVNVVDPKTSIELPNDPNMPELEDIVYSDDDEDVGAEADMNNLDAFMPVSPIPTTRIHKDHPVEQIIRDLHSAPQTRRMTKNLEEHGLFSSVQQRINHKDFQNCLFACFLSQEEPKKVIQALKDPSWIEAMQDELLQFKLQKV
ncbi:hypothetical protein Tco_0396653 [Tanacetum coccineum]